MTKARDIASAAPAPSTVSATELGYLDGVTSAIQTQINTKQATVSGVDDTEIGYLNGVTSAIQTQLDGKVANTLIDAKGDLLVGSAADTVARLAVGTNNHVLTADSSATNGVKWAAAAGGGKVLQVVSTAKTDAFSTATAAFTDVTGLSVTITPTASTSKILVLVTLNASARDGQGNSGARIVRDSTDIFIGDTASNRVRVTTDISRNDVYANKNFGLTYLDSPATTSATTYKVQVSGLPSSSGWTTYVNRSYDDTDSSSFGRSASSITVMEIGA
jgi:hypothetical protein